jgi:VWFA-related protein
MRALICAWSPASLFAQSPDPPLVLRSETRAVQIHVVASSNSGDPIRDLRREDFMVFDDGKPRRIQFFSKDSDGADSGPSSRAPGRTTAIVLDGLNTAFPDQSYARDRAIQAVGRMQLDESIAILFLAPGLRLQNFTRDRELLLGAIRGFQPNIPPYGLKQLIQVTLAALKTLADRMSHTAGRKSIVWITGGFPRIAAYERSIETVLHQINEADVAVYPVDARGLMLGRGSNFEIMDQFAESTGGKASYNGNDVAAAIDAAIEDARSTYVIGFYLGDNERDRRFHELKVEVDRPGAVLSYRRGYSPSDTARQ